MKSIEETIMALAAKLQPSLFVSDKKALEQSPVGAPGDIRPPDPTTIETLGCKHCSLGPCCSPAAPAFCKCIGWYVSPFSGYGPAVDYTDSPPPGCPSRAQLDSEGYTQGEWLAIRNTWAAWGWLSNRNNPLDLLFPPAWSADENWNPLDPNYVTPPPMGSPEGTPGLSNQQYWNDYWNNQVPQLHGGIMRFNPPYFNLTTPSLLMRKMFEMGCFGQIAQPGACCIPCGDGGELGGRMCTSQTPAACEAAGGIFTGGECGDPDPCGGCGKEEGGGVVLNNQGAGASLIKACLIKALKS